MMSSRHEPSGCFCAAARLQTVVMHRQPADLTVCLASEQLYEWSSHCRFAQQPLGLIGFMQAGQQRSLASPSS